MHAKSAEVTQFLERDLLPQVKEAFAQYRPADKAALQKDLDKAIEQARALGADPETLPRVKELRAQLVDSAVDLNGLEGEVFDHLYTFFRRYYTDGDFLTRRVYKAGVYAIPYEGEEVVLHWANKDQYYIKTSEYLRDYVFRLRPEDQKDPMRVHFRVVDAAEGEHGNVKSSEGKDRVFTLAAGGASGHDFLREEHGVLSIGFEYRPATLSDWPESERSGKARPPAQKDLTANAVARLLACPEPSFRRWVTELAKSHVLNAASAETADYSRLEAHLRRYTARNAFDYFIHKDLRGFLSRELDFYIKNEVMHLDDIEQESAPRLEQYLSKIRALRHVATKLIAFLAQLEDFQKRIWLKAKFVVDTQYLITLKRVDEVLYQSIASNAAQRQEWVRLFHIDLIEPTLSHPGYSEPLSIEFLKAHNHLPVNTCFFAPEVVHQLLSSLSISLPRSTSTAYLCATAKGACASAAI